MSKKNARPKPAQQDLVDSVRFVVYELFMLRQSIDMCKNQGTFLRSLAYEGVVLHARVLRDFFYKKRNKDGDLVEPKTDDILAADYFTNDPDWPYTYAEMSKYLVDTKGRMDRTLAHLSFDRLKYKGKDKGWDEKAIRDDIGDRWFEFLGNLQKAGAPYVPHFLRWAAEYSVPTTSPF